MRRTSISYGMGAKSVARKTLSAKPVSSLIIANIIARSFETHPTVVAFADLAVSEVFDIGDQDGFICSLLNHENRQLINQRP